MDPTEETASQTGLVLPPIASNTSGNTDGNESQYTDEEDDLINNNDIANNSNAELNNTYFNQKTEIINDGNGQWIPIHLLRKTKAKFWTHYLAISKNLNIVKCKHCGQILEKFDNNNNNNINSKSFQRHLKQKHNINPLSDYYYDNSTSNNTNSRSLRNTNNKIFYYNEEDNELAMPNNESISSDIINDQKSAKERELSFSTSQLLAIIIASENLSFDFTNDSAVRILLSRLSQSYIPDITNIKNCINITSNQINDIIKRTSLRNIADLQLIIQPTTLSNDLNQRQRTLLNKIKSHLLQMNKLTFFSLIIHNWNKQKNYNVLSLQFWDSSKNSTKTIPLSIIQGTNNINPTTVSIRSQLLNAFNNIPGLYKSVLSITLQRSRLLNISNLDDHDFFQREKGLKNIYHNCLVTMLIHSIKLIFGDLKNNDTNNEPNTPPLNNKPRNFYTNNNDSLLLDSIIDLTDLQINNPLFQKIKTVYDEIESNPWQLDRFNSLVKQHFPNEMTSKKRTKLIQFDQFFYSTMENTLESFITLRPILESLQKNLQIEPLTDRDFYVANYLLNYIRTINKLILFFTKSKQMNFIYVIYSVLALEKFFNESLTTIRSYNLLKPFENALNKIVEFKNILIEDKMNQLALFCCPAVLFDREILEYIFKTVSLSDIVKTISGSILDIFKKFMNIHIIDNPNNKNVATTSNTTTDLNNNNDETQSNENENINTNNNTFNDEDLNFFNANDHHLIENDIDTVLSQLIQEDLYDYLSTVNTIVPLSYKAFCDQSGYIRGHGTFNKKVTVVVKQPNGEDKEVTKNEEMSHLEQLLDIHIPVCNAFWEQFLENDAGCVIRILSKIMLTESASSIRAEYAFLDDFVPKIGDEFLESILKIKLFNQQFPAGKIDYDLDTLPTASQY